MDATQQIDDSFCEEEDDTDGEKEKGGEKKEREPLAALKVFKNNYIQETEVPLYQGENVLGRDPAACSVPLLARSISGCHAVISISVFHANDRRHGGSDGMEALLWDLGSLNGTRKGRMKLTPHVRYALTEGDSVVLADLPCQYISLRNVERISHVTIDKDKVKSPAPVVTGPGETGRGVQNERKKSVPPVPIWGHKGTSFQSPQMTPKQPERTLVPESDSDSDSEGEKGVQRERRKFLDSASSDLSSPTCSTFLTPANKVIPESEDESFIMPCSAVTGRSTKDHSEASSDSLKPVPLNLDSDTEDEKEDEVTGMKGEPEVNATSTPQGNLVDPACLRMDSDTEDEKEDEVTGMKSEPEVNAASTPQGNPVDPVCLRMDSDTDVEDAEVEETKSSNISPVFAPKDSVTPAGFTVDSDTDVEENEPFKTETAPTSGTKAVLEEKTSSEFHLDSDTDVEDEDAPVMPKLETLASIPPANPVAEFQLGSDTDAEEEEKPTGATEMISNSDTEDEDPFKPTKGRTMEKVKVPQAKTVQENSNSDTDVEDDKIVASPLPNKDNAAQVQPPAEKVQIEFRMDSDTDAEEEEEKLEEREQKAPETAEGNIQYSAPRGAGVSEEEMETQAFLSPSQPFKHPALPSPLQSSVSPGGCSDDFTVAETQSFVSDAFAANGNLDETRLSLKGCGGSSFQLGVSDSGNQQPDLEEHTETADAAEEDWDLQATQLYAMRGASAGAGLKRLDLEATQAYLVSEEREEKAARPLEEENDNSESNGVPDSDERAGRATGCHGEMMDSHPSTADTLILIRSPKLEEPTQPYAMFTAQTLPFSVEEEEQEEEVFSNETGRNTHPCKGGQVDEEPAQPLEPKANNRVAIAETQLMVEDEGEDEQSEATSTRKQCRGREVAKIEPTQPLEFEENSTVAVAETQPVGEDEETQEEEQPDGLRRFCEGETIAKIEPTQPLELEENTTVAIAEVQPVGEEEEAQEVKQRGGTRRTIRSKNFAKPEPTQLLDSEPSTNVAIAETQPISEGEEEREKEQRSEPTSSRRSRRRKEVDKVEETQPLESAVAETQPMGEDEGGQEEEQQGQPRRPNRRRRTTKAEPTQPLKPDPSTSAEEEAAQEESSKRSLRGKGREPSGRGRGKGRATAEKEGKKKRGRATLEEEEDSKVEVDEGRKGRGRKSTRQKSKERDDGDRLELKEEKERETREEQVKMEMEEGEQKEQEERNRLEKERVERERADNEMKQRLEQEQEEEERNRREKEREEENAARGLLEKERIEREQRERLENENKQREKEEKERLEMERLEKEEREREEKEKREREEKERLEKEKWEREEKERLENEKREREERERLEKEKKEREEVEQRLEKEMREQEEKETLEKERKEKEEKEQTKREMKEREKLAKEERELKEKEKKVNEGEGGEKGKRQGRRRAGPGRKENESKEDEELEDKNGQMENAERTSMKKEEEPGETAKVKPSRGRRPGRKSTAPPAGTEESVSADVPAKRTRSRSNSSNSVSSEQSLLSTLDEQTRGHGRGRARGRKPAEEKVENSRPSGRRKTVMAQSTEMEQDAGPCAVTQNKAKGGRGRKCMKVEKPDEEAPHEPPATPRGRGRGGKRPDPGDVTVDATEQTHQEKDKSNTVSVNEHSVISQTPSRGRKRSAETTLAESPQPTSKTPRRSLASQTHKVLFTGVVDEDGEKVLVRLGGGLAKGVGDMTHLVTDKVRRTVKFLCAVARGVPIVTLDWLTKCGKAGTFLSCTEFLVKDREQERKFNFKLQEALKVASRQPLLQGYEIHVTPSVKPEPSHMKDIITCCGARYLPKMPSAHKAQAVVVSCEEDRALCSKALSLAVPVVSAEFLLTGILQQKVDLQTHALSASPAAASKPASQGRRK